MCPPLEMKDIYGESYIKGGTFIVVITVFWQKQREEVDKVTGTNLQSYFNIFFGIDSSNITLTWYDVIFFY